MLVLGNTYSLEQRLQLSDPSLASGGPTSSGGVGASTYGHANDRSQGGKGNAIHGLLTHDKGESLLRNLLLPLCLKVGSGRKDAPKMRPQDVKFSLNLLLNLLNPTKGMYFRSQTSFFVLLIILIIPISNIKYHPIFALRIKRLWKARKYYQHGRRSLSWKYKKFILHDTWRLFRVMGCSSLRNKVKCTIQPSW